MIGLLLILALAAPSLPANTPPTIQTSGPFNAVPGAAPQQVTLAVVDDLEDAPGSLVILGVAQFPGPTVNGITNTNGTITADVSASASTPAGTYTLPLIVEDSGGLRDTGYYSVNVSTAANTPPAVAASTLSCTAGEVPSTQLMATVSDAQDSAGALPVSVSGLPMGVTITNLQNTNGMVTADVEATAAAVGSHTVTLTVEDSDQFATTVQVPLTVTGNVGGAAGQPAGGGGGGGCVAGAGLRAAWILFPLAGYLGRRRRLADKHTH